MRVWVTKLLCDLWCLAPLVHAPAPSWALAFAPPCERSVQTSKACSVARRAQHGAPLEDPHDGAPAGVMARRYQDGGPTTGARRRPDAMIDRDERDTERTAERFELRSAQEVASRFASLPGAAGEAGAGGATA